MLLEEVLDQAWSFRTCIITLMTLTYKISCPEKLGHPGSGFFKRNMSSVRTYIKRCIKRVTTTIKKVHFSHLVSIANWDARTRAILTLVLPLNIKTFMCVKVFLKASIVVVNFINAKCKKVIIFFQSLVARSNRPCEFLLLHTGYTCFCLAIII